MMKILPAFFAPLLLTLFSACSSTKNAAEKLPPAVQQTAPEARPDSLLQSLMRSQASLFAAALDEQSGNHVQIIYTQINRRPDNSPVFTHHYFNAAPGVYFYPASTVKMPIALLALQKLNDLKVAGLNKYSTMITETADASQTAVYNDPSSADGRPSIAHYIRKIFLVSDNDASNRLYEFLGQEYLNKTLHQMGYDSVQLLHRLSVPLNEAQNRLTNPIRFFDSSGNPVYQQAAQKSNLQYQPRNTYMGKGYYSAGKLVNQPFNFSDKNRFSLADLHAVLTSVIFPEAVPATQRFNLSEDDYRFLYRYMGMMPRESDFPPYDTAHYTDAYVKFFMFGGGGPIQDNQLRIFNKVGDAYGFLTDVAYVVDFKNGVEFLLSASIYCNSDGVFNDDKYDYDNVGFPFLKNLGNLIYDYEKGRAKAIKPDLSRMAVH